MLSHCQREDKRNLSMGIIMEIQFSYSLLPEGVQPESQLDSDSGNLFPPVMIFHLNKKLRGHTIASAYQLHCTELLS